MVAGERTGRLCRWRGGRYADPALSRPIEVHGHAAKAQASLEPTRDHLLDAGLGAVSEIFDSAPPHHPHGTLAQAWSVACVLEAWQRMKQLKGEYCPLPPAG